jgi:DNA anti-recombination protein RmuC
MSADQQLQAAYAEWRRLAEAEGDAIRARNWNLATDCQNALRQLQPVIIRSSQEAQVDWARLGEDRDAKENHLRAVISELISIESRNNSLLNGMHDDAQARLNELKQAGHMLRRVHRLYGPPLTAAWNSFS